MAACRVAVHFGNIVGSFEASAKCAMPYRSSANATIACLAPGVDSIRCACSVTPSGVCSASLAAASSRTSSGTEFQSAEARREAISKLVYLSRPPSGALGTPSSTRYRKLGDCNIAQTAWRIPTSTVLPVLLPMVVASVRNRPVSSALSGRRKARRPMPFSAWVMQAVSDVLVGTQDSTAAAWVASAKAYCVAAPVAASYWPTPDAEADRVDAPTVAKPSTMLSGSTGPSGAAWPRRSRTLFANCEAVSFSSRATGSDPADAPVPVWPAPAWPVDVPELAPVPPMVDRAEEPGGPIAPVQAKFETSTAARIAIRDEPNRLGTVSSWIRSNGLMPTPQRLVVGTGRSVHRYSRRSRQPGLCQAREAKNVNTFSIFPRPVKGETR